jgi:hypothetical protein
VISRAEFDRTLTYLDRTGIPADIEAKLADARAKDGCPRNLKARILLAGIMLCAQHRGTTVMTKVHRLLTTSLDARQQQLHGIRRPDGSTVTVRQLRYLFRLITDLYEHSTAYAPDLDDITRAGRADAFQALLDALTGEARRHLRPASAYAVDETAIESAARGKRNNQRAAQEEGRAAAGERGHIRVADRDARWGHKTKTYENQSGLIFGYQAVTFTRVAPVGGPAEPILCDRIALVPGNDNGAAATLDVLGGFGRAEQLPREILVDRGFSQLGTEGWAAPLAALGVRQVFDLKVTDRGARPHPRDGYLMIDGQPYCPSIPEELIVIPRPVNLSAGKLPKHPTKEQKAEHDTRQKNIDEFNDAIATREQYRFAPVGKTKAGQQRWQCPARAGKVSCVGCPFSIDYPDTVARVQPADPANLPKACRQETITIRDDVDLKRRQEHPWGSPAWQASYSRRARAEGTHGILKASDSGAVRRGFTRYTGLVRTGMVLALAVAQSNLVMLTKWAVATNNHVDPLTTIDVTPRPFQELDPDDGAAGGLAPPAAA